MSRDFILWFYKQLFFFPICWHPLPLPPHKLQGQIKTTFIATGEHHSLGCKDFVISNSANKIHLIIGVSTKNMIITIFMLSVMLFLDLQQNLSPGG